MQNKIAIEKLNLLEGESVFDFLDKVAEAVRSQGHNLGKIVHLMSVYNDDAVVRDADSGRLYQMKIERAEGDLTLGPPVEVRMVFVPVKQEKSEDAGVQYVMQRSTWNSVVFGVDHAR